MCSLYLSLLILAMMSGMAVAELKSCYNETHWLTGNPTGQKEICSGNLTEYCYKVIGNTMDKTLNPRGCANTYLHKTGTCQWRAAVFVFTLTTKKYMESYVAVRMTIIAICQLLRDHRIFC
ncbi:hypothetical protein M3Y96_00802400 [Aphelenchoides besseyi]|nr:hypothetical protein M3Y96_00802400 [Aphelenchoides besseyi]